MAIWTLQGCRKQLQVQYPSLPGGRSLRKIMQELAVPEWQRERLPLVFASPRTGKPLAIADCWIADGLRSTARSVGARANLLAGTAVILIACRPVEVALSQASPTPNNLPGGAFHDPFCFRHWWRGFIFGEGQSRPLRWAPFSRRVALRSPWSSSIPYINVDPGAP